MIVMLVVPESFPQVVILQDPVMRTMMWLLALVFILGASMGFAQWLKDRFIHALLISSVCVIIGMWLERWNIIVPTVTHPRLVAYTTYVPTLTEIAITAGSFALLVLLPLLFFKLFPVVSIWEVAEGRVIDAEYEKVEIPMPVPSTMGRRLRGFRRFRGD